MDQKTHIVGGIFLATAVMIAGESPLVASLAVFGSMFNDLDLVDIPWSSQGVHRKLFHNIFVMGVFASLSLKYAPLGYWVLGMGLHSTMDMFSKAPVYVLWPLPPGERDWGIGGWGVPNDSFFSFPTGVAAALLFTFIYLVATDHLGDAIALGKALYHYFFDILVI